MASPDLSISTPPTSLHSSDEPPTIQFSSLKELRQEIDHVSGDFLIVKNVSLADFEELVLQERRPFRLRRYDADRRILIITIPSTLHEVLHRTIWEIFHTHLVQNGLTTSWQSIGSATFRAQGRHGGNGGEGDSTGRPKPARHFKGAWPTLVIEAGVSEPLSALRDDMRWWFLASDHQVNIVLLTKFDGLNQKIIIERWEEEPQTRLGATGTILQPALRQSITMTWDATNDLYHVTGSALVLSFRLLFLRDPGPQGRDVIVSIAELQGYARDVFVEV